VITLTDKNNLSSTYPTESYILLTIENESIKGKVDISLKDIRPLLIKAVLPFLEKMGR